MKLPLLVLFFSLLIFGAAQAAPPAKAPPKLEKGAVLKGSINQLLYLCSTAGITLNGESLPSIVTKIRLGSPAAYYGVQEKDKVELASIENNLLKLELERDGIKVQVSLPVSAQALRDSVAKASGAKAKLEKFMEAMPEPVSIPTALQIKLAAQEKASLQKFQSLCTQAGKNLPPAKQLSPHKDLRALADYDMVLLLDCSGSMSGNIMRKTDFSRWRWAKEQMLSISSEIEAVFKKGITVVPFTEKYKVYQPCFASDVQSIFLHNKPSGGTNLFPPLEEVLTYKITSKRPMYICIFTDGEFGYRQEIKDLIVAATNGIAGPYDLRINFLILDDNHIPAELAALENLTTSGAKYDIVNVRDINYLRSRGLQNAIIESVSKP